MKRHFLHRVALFVLVLTSHSLHAKLDAFSIEKHVVTLQTTQGEVQIKRQDGESFVIDYLRDGQAQLPSFALAYPRQALPVKVSEYTSYVTITYAEQAIHVDKATGRLAFYYAGEEVVSEKLGLVETSEHRGFSFQLDTDEKLYGGGQRLLGMDRRGHKMPLYNKAHYGYTTESNQMYYGLSAVLSDQRYAILFDNSAKGELDIGHTYADELRFNAVTGRTSYVVVLGNSVQQVSQNIAKVTGKQPLLPRWALGNFASRFGYKTQTQTLATAQAYIDNDIPLDAIVLDLYWFGPDIKGHMGNLDWYRPNFPTPENMIQTLTTQGVNTVLITEPFILSTSKQWTNAVANKALATNIDGAVETFDFYFGNTGLVDVFNQDAANWFLDFYSRLAQQGVTGWWGDLGEPEVHPATALHNIDGRLVGADAVHNAYGHQWAKILYEHQLKTQPELRPFIMMRSGFLGSQRYGMIPWTGDVSRSWGGLQGQIELMLQMSAFGVAYIHSDLGGFAGGDKFDAELYLRWLEFGAFTPVFRPHAQDNIAPEPVFHSEDVIDIARDIIKLRYALTPYNYSLSLANSMTGEPLVRPVSFMDESRFTDAKHYLWGDAFLVAPVKAAGVTKQAIDLPEGVWFDYWQKQKWTGEQSISVQAPIGQIPLLVKAGSFIPTVSPTQHLKAYNTRNLHIAYYADAAVQESTYVMYEDDGASPQTLGTGAYQSIIMTAAQRGKALSLLLTVKGTYARAPLQRTIHYTVYGVNNLPQRVIIDGKHLAESQWQWDELTNSVRFTAELQQQAQINIIL